MIEVTWEFICDECGSRYQFQHSQLSGIGFHTEIEIPTLDPRWRLLNNMLICPRHDVKIITPGSTPL